LTDVQKLEAFAQKTAEPKNKQSYLRKTVNEQQNSDDEFYLEGVDYSTGFKLTHDQIMASVKQFTNNIGKGDELDDLVEVMDFDIEKAAKNVIISRGTQSQIVIRIIDKT